MNRLATLLLRRDVLFFVLVMNVIGVCFGFAWYRGQLARTSTFFWPFVPDSPVSAFFFTVVLTLALTMKNASRQAVYRLFSALCATWLVKYGLWCDTVLLTQFANVHWLPLEAWLLIISHTGMMVEAFLYTLVSPLLTFEKGELFVAGATLFLNDYVDYVYGVFPYLPNHAMLPFVTIATPLMTLATVSLFYRIRLSSGIRQRENPSPSTS